MGQEVTRDRQSVRASVALTARYADPIDARQLEGMCQNMSRSGMFLGTPRPAAVGAVLKLECELVDGTGRIRATARVMWVRREADGAGRPAGMGLRFLNLETGCEQLIDDLLARGDIGTSGRRARSDPPDERSDSQRPRLVPVATMREVGAGGKTQSSNPPPGKKTRDASELRERWKDARKTRRGFPISDGQPSSSAPPPPTAEAETNAASEILPPAPRAPQATTVGVPAEPNEAELDARSRTTEPEAQAPRFADPSRSTEPERAKAEGPAQAPGAAEDDSEAAADPKWRVERLAELVDAEAKAQRDALEHRPTSPKLEVEEAVLVRGPSILTRPSARGARIVVGLLVVGGLLFFVLGRKTGAPTGHVAAAAAAAAEPPKVVVPAPLPAPPAASPVGSAPEPLPRGLDVPAEAPEASAPKPAAEATRRSSTPSAPSTRSRPPATSQNAPPAPAAAPPAPAPDPAPEPPPVMTIGSAAGSSALDAALACLKVGDSACAVKALDGKAKSAQEWELLIESQRALGNTSAAEAHMRTYLERFPSGSMGKSYRRQLEYQRPASGGDLPDKPRQPVVEGPRVAPPPAPLTPQPTAPASPFE